MTEERFNELVKKAQKKMVESSDKILQTMLDEINAEEAAEVRECACNEDCECGCGPCCEHDCAADPDLTYEDTHTILNKNAIDETRMDYREITMSYDEDFEEKDAMQAIRVDFENDAVREEVITAALLGCATLIKHFFAKEDIKIDTDRMMAGFMKVIGNQVVSTLFKELF